MKLWACRALVLGGVGTVGAVRVGKAWRGGLRGRQLDDPTPASSYDYLDHGVSWNDGKCCVPLTQSPINVSAASESIADGELLFYRYMPFESPVTMLNDGHGLVASFDTYVGSIAVGVDYPNQLTSTYDLWQILFHVPSEHTFDGVQVPLEMQLIHKQTGPDGSPLDDAPLAAVAIGFVGGVKSNGFLDSLRQGGLPKQAGEEATVNREYPALLDFSEILGKLGNSTMPAATNGTPGAGVHLEPGSDLDHGFWQYTGSLTTPPCQTGVQWFVRPTPLSASVEALTEFRTAIQSVASLGQEGDKGNNRVLQPACGRTVMWRPVQDSSQKPGLPTPAPLDPSFKGAVATAGGEQEAFKAAMEGAGTDTASKAYLQCCKDLGEADSDLQGAESQQNSECAGEKAAEQKLANAGQGLTRIAAAAELAGQKEACASATQVAVSLKDQVESQRKECEKLKPAQKDT